MNIYLCERTDCCGWEEYDACVVAAESATDARSQATILQDGVWTVEQIGETILDSSILLASYVAG